MQAGSRETQRCEEGKEAPSDSPHDLSDQWRCPLVEEPWRNCVVEFAGLLRPYSTSRICWLLRAASCTDCSGGFRSKTTEASTSWAITSKISFNSATDSMLRAVVTCAANLISFGLRLK